MKAVFNIFFLCFVFLSTPAYATEPCIRQTPQEFLQTKTDSDLILRAVVENYAKDEPHGWTEIRVLESYKGTPPSDTMRIHEWTSHYHPLYIYDKGAVMIILLKKDGHRYIPTDLDWSKCVPSVIGLGGRETFFWQGENLSRDAYIRARLNPDPDTE